MQGDGRAEAGGRPADMKALVIVPTYNERDNIRALLRAVLAYPGFGVLVVDDSSPDGTGDMVATVARSDPRVSLLCRPARMGMGTAYIAGFRRALGSDAEFIFEMDADFSHDPGYLPELLETAKRGFDLVLGSRYIPGGATPNWGWLRRVISRGGNRFARTVLHLPVRDATAGYRCYRRQALEAIDLSRIRSNGYGFQVEMVYWVLRAGLRVTEIPIIFTDRRVGQSKMSTQIVLEAAVTVCRLRLAGACDPLNAAGRGR